MSRPVIGITAAIESAGWGVWKEVETNLSPRTFSREVSRSGALPILLPAHEAERDSADDLLRLLDGLLLAGGADLDPRTYGAEPDQHTTGYRAERDRFEVALARAALERQIPVLGICRGMQLLNVALGGTLEQHIGNLDLHLHTPGEYSDHDVRLETGSLAARAIGAERVAVRSHHHQGIERLGDGLEASGWAEPDNLVEAIESPDGPFTLGLLWHAEEERGGAVMTAFIDAVAAREAVS